MKSCRIRTTQMTDAARGGFFVQLKTRIKSNTSRVLRTVDVCCTRILAAAAALSTCEILIFRQPSRYFTISDDFRRHTHNTLITRRPAVFAVDAINFHRYIFYARTQLRSTTVDVINPVISLYGCSRSSCRRGLFRLRGETVCPLTSE